MAKIGPMESMMDRLEAYRTEHRLSKAEMARRMGAAAQQNYTNWVNRDSLPKQFYPKAAELLGDEWPLGSTATPDNYEDSVFSMLSPEEKRELVLSLLGELDAAGRLAALRFLMQKDDG